MADEEAATTELGPLGGDVGLGRFVAVLGVDEDEVEFTIVETACGLDRWQADRVPVVGVGGHLTQRDRQAL